MKSFYYCMVLACFMLAMTSNSYSYPPEYAVCTNVSNYPLVKSAGYDYVESNVAYLMPDKSDAEFQVHLDEINKVNAKIISCTSFIPASLTLTGTETRQDEAKVWAGTALRRAGIAKIPYIIFGSGKARNVPENFSKEKAIAQFVSFCKQIAPLAEQYDVTILIEPLNRSETNMINSLEEGARIVEAVGHSHVQLLCDIYHMMRENEPASEIVKYGKYIRHCHIAEREERTSPGTKGDDFRPYFSALKEIDYQGCVSIECRWRDFQNEIKPALAYMQSQWPVSATSDGQEVASQVKNVILMIGDGMGISQVYAGMTANKGTLNLEKCQFVGFSKTYSANNYITDSAAGGTAIACGTKTNNGAIGVDEDGNPVKSILEYASENGLATGVVASCAITHATPASFVAHQPSRKMEEEIAEDFVNSDVTLFIGGGKKQFESRADKVNLLKKLTEKGFQLAFDLDDIKKITTGKLAGLVADKHPDPYPKRGEFLPESVKAAINLLKNDDDGFFLMIEGSQIDWASHANNGKATVNEVLDFDRAIKVAFDYADKDPNTLVIVTADHETGGMALTGGELSTGKVKTAFTTTGHTSVMVPLFAYGAGAIEFAGIYENTAIFSKILDLFGFEK